MMAVPNICIKMKHGLRRMRNFSNIQEAEIKFLLSVKQHTRLKVYREKVLNIYLVNGNRVKWTRK